MINAEILNILATKAAADSKAHGYSDHVKPVSRTFVKAVCEVAEAVEAFRDKRYAGKKQFETAMKDFNFDNRPGWVQQKYHQTAYKQMAKNTVQDEMADVCIYLLDAAGNINADLTIPKRENEQKMREFIKVHDFIENAGQLMMMLVTNEEFKDEWKRIIDCIDFVTIWCDEMFKQDIRFWIDNKMVYNKNRPYRHGRKDDPTV